MLPQPATGPALAAVAPGGSRTEATLPDVLERAGRSVRRRLAGPGTSRAAVAAAAWTAGYGALRLHWTLGGQALRPRCSGLASDSPSGCVFDRTFTPGPLAGWGAVGLCAAGAAVAAALLEPGRTRPPGGESAAADPEVPRAAGSRRVLGRRVAVLAAAWVAWAATFDNALFYYSFELLRLVGLATGPMDWAAFGNRSLLVVGAVLFALSAWSYQVATRADCERCGRPRQQLSMPVPRRAELTAYGACLALLPYVGLKTAWSQGFNVAGFGGYPDDFPHLAVDPTVLAGVLGMGLALALVQPWGEAIPRGLMLTLAWTGTAPPLGVGLLGTAGTVASLLGVWSPAPDAALPLPVFVGVYTSFLLVGLLLAATIRSYQRRHRLHCPCGGGDPAAGHRTAGHRTARGSPAPS